jgi:hypothetical protein
MAPSCVLSKSHGVHFAAGARQYILITLEQNLLCSYSGLFVDRCTNCQRVLSVEGHVPPVGRIWTGSGTGNENEKGQWQPRHILCLHS